MSVRLPRFRRAAEVPKIQLTDRDQELLRHVRRHRFLRSPHLVALMGGSRQRVVRRLQWLFHHSYLERPLCQVDYYHRSGSQPMVYGLGNKGLGLLKRTLGLAYHELEWGRTNRAVGRLFLEHALLVSDVMVALELACRKSGRVRLFMGRELSIPAATALQRDPFHWQVKVPGRDRIGLIPDRVFALKFLDRPAGKNLAYFFLEADRGTMPVTRANPAQSSFQRKLLAYEATWAQNLHRSRFGFHRFRVLTVTSSRERIASLQQATRQLERGHGLFLFTDIQSVQRAADVLTLDWQTGRADQTARLTD